MTSSGQLAGERYIEAMRAHAILDTGIQKDDGWRRADRVRSTENPEEPTGRAESYSALLILPLARPAQVVGPAIAKACAHAAGRRPVPEPTCDGINRSVRYFGQRGLLEHRGRAGRADAL